MYKLFVVKLDKRESYTIIDNTVLKDKTISLKAKGLLCFVLSLSPTWNFSREGLIACCKEGRDAVDNAMSELEEKGYLKRDSSKKHGKYNMVYKFYEIPFEKYLAISEKRKRKIRRRKPATEKLTQINTNKINTESNKTNYRVDRGILDEIKTKINYNILVEKHEEYDVNKIVMIVASVITSDEEDESIKNLFRSLTSYHIEYVLKKAKSNSGKIKNYDAWLKKVICNIPPKMQYQIRESDFTNHVESEDGW